MRFQRTFHEKSFASGFGADSPNILLKIKKQGKPCFLRIYLTVCSLLECCANSVCARCRIARSYIYFLCRAVAFAVMIYAVGNVAIYTFVAFACVLIVCIVIHFFQTPFCEFDVILCRTEIFILLYFLLFCFFIFLLWRKICLFLSSAIRICRCLPKNLWIYSANVGADMSKSSNMNGNLS